MKKSSLESSLQVIDGKIELCKHSDDFNVMSLHTTNSTSGKRETSREQTVLINRPQGIDKFCR